MLYADWIIPIQESEHKDEIQRSVCRSEMKKRNQLWNGINGANVNASGDHIIETRSQKRKREEVEFTVNAIFGASLERPTKMSRLS
jgi:hypothetical protein